MKRPTEGEAALILIDRAYRSGTDMIVFSQLTAPDLAQQACMILYEREYVRQYKAARAAITEINRLLNEH